MQIIRLVFGKAGFNARGAFGRRLYLWRRHRAIPRTVILLNCSTHKHWLFPSFAIGRRLLKMQRIPDARPRTPTEPRTS